MDDVSCIGSKVGHQIESLSLPHCLRMLHWHYQLVLSRYLHQPESHQLSQPNLSHSLTDIRTHRSDPRTPGSDKKNCDFLSKCSPIFAKIPVHYCQNARKLLQKCPQIIAKIPNLCPNTCQFLPSRFFDFHGSRPTL